MMAFTLVPIVMLFLALSTEAANDEGISGWCEKTRINPRRYGPTLDECCGEKWKCEDIIKPGETKYGLTNSNRRWSRRHCDCDLDLFKCVVDTTPVAERSMIVERLQHEICFQRRNIRYRGALAENNKFVTLLDAAAEEFAFVGKK